MPASFGTPGGRSQCSTGQRISLSHGVQQRHVVDAVRIGVTLLQIDPGLITEPPHRSQLARTPDEVTLYATGQHATRTCVRGGDHLIETDLVGKGPDEVGRCGRSQHEQATFLAVLVERRPRERLHYPEQTRRRQLPGTPEVLFGPTRDELRGAPDERHHGEALSEQLVEAIDGATRRQSRAALHEADFTQGVVDNRATCSTQECAVEVDEDGRLLRRGDSRRRSHR
jgi:hypothetical protein